MIAFGRHRSRGQGGGAMMLAIVVMLMLLGLALVVTTAAINSSAGTKRDLHRSQADESARAGVGLYSLMLNAGLVDDGDQYLPTPQVYAASLPAGDGIV